MAVIQATTRWKKNGGPRHLRPISFASISVFFFLRPKWNNGRSRPINCRPIGIDGTFKAAEWSATSSALPPPTPFSSVPSNWLFISRSLSLTGPSTCQRWPLFGSENYFPLDCYLVEMSTNRWKISLKWMNFCGNFLKIFGKKNMFVTEGTIQVTIRYFLLQGLRMEQKCNKRWPQVAQEETVGSNRSVPIHRNSGTCVWILVPLRPVFKETKYRVTDNWYDTCWLHTEKIPTFPAQFQVWHQGLVNVLHLWTISWSLIGSWLLPVSHCHLT